MIQEERTSVSPRIEAAQAAIESGDKRLNQTVLEGPGYCIWVSMALAGQAPIAAERRCGATRTWRTSSRALDGNGMAFVSDVVIGASRDGVIVGMVVLRAGVPFLQADRRHADVIEALRREGRTLCELDRLALDNRENASEIAVLFKIASLCAVQIRGATDLVTEVRPHQVEAYRRLFGFIRASENERHALLGRSRVLLRLEVEHELRQSAVAEHAAARVCGDALTDAQMQEAKRRLVSAVAAASGTPSQLLTIAAERHAVDASGDPFIARPFAVRGAAISGSLDTRSFDEGLRAGAHARQRRDRISAYQRVGLDDFTRGFRAGYFASRTGAIAPGESGRNRAVR